MRRHILFFHGGGSIDDFHADEELVQSLRQNLGSHYVVHYSYLDNDGTADFGRRKQISEQINASEDGVLIVAHSLGASMVLVCLSEKLVHKKVNGLFLLATPFWTGDEAWAIPLKLQPDFASKIDRKIPVHFYHCQDDQEVPFKQFKIYKQHLPWASFHELSKGGHQFNNDLVMTARHIKALTELE